MKKIITLLLLATTTIYAQDQRPDIFDRKHEVKLGAIKLLAGPILEGTYEYIQNRDFTFGVSVLGNLDSKNDYYEDFSVTPFARFYFQETKEFGAKGFFVEGFAKYSSGRNTTDDWLDEESEKYSAAALGISLGKKWINRTGFVFEILGGIGRTLGNSDAAPDVIFRGDLNLGYRF
ncbi:DUF3575 domain-containing protein [Flavobacterium magnum]|uniref:DUF3575 domain-containing protein n=1 Tax=Flavobacterium magnum TaxID=2162713 RepID=A0A2S0RDH4_9FLAO|nr:DUF3575 domain-containing protein [Flavobacterium magnum]AWA29308.1 DUF3575 domain-containing protein [Flavobacterium magnum]